MPLGAPTVYYPRSLPAGATGDIWIGLTERGGDGVADPALGYVAVSFK